MEQIATLPDDAALRAITLIIAYERLTPSPNERVELEEKLREAVGDPELADYAAATVPSAGDIARTTLALIAEGTNADPKLINDAIGLAQRPDRSGLEAVGLFPLVAGILQTQVKFERKVDGKWTFLFNKTPASDSTLGKLLGQLISLITHRE